MNRRIAVACVFVLIVSLVVPATALARTSTKVSASLDSKWEHYDWVPTLSARLTTKSGKGIGAQTLTLYRNGSKVTSRRTDTSGRASFGVVVPEDDRQGFWQVRYAGKGSYGPPSPRHSPHFSMCTTTRGANTHSATTPTMTK